MITENNIKTLQAICSNLTNKDWYNANKNSTRAKFGKFTESGLERKWNTYSLSSNTLEAHGMLVKAVNKDISFDDIEIVKSYLLKIRMSQPELLEDIRQYSFK